MESLNKMVIPNASEGELHINKFVALLTASMEYFVYTEQILTETMENTLSTKYKERFAIANRGERKKLQNAYDSEMRKFKVQFKEFKKKNEAMLKHMDTLKASKADKFNAAIDEIFTFTDKLITNDKGD
jgi:hypothetical protein